MSDYTLHHGDCLDVMRTLPENSVDAIVTDPPYGLAFMGKRWDYDVPSVDIWSEALRVLKPGGHLLAFAGTRTQHRMAVRIEDAGFEIRDMIAWVYGSGFPKSHNLKDDWQGWGTALKPALEPITLARKPLIGTVAENVLAHGTGGLNIEDCRVGTDGGTRKAGPPSFKCGTSLAGSVDGSLNGGVCVPINSGRWPANFIHDGSEEATDLLGNSARFFYCAKASKSDRGDNHHPTVKPTELMAYLCGLVTPPNGIVLDPFMGSGSTGKAAIREGFQFIGIERDADYVQIARQRIENATQQSRLAV